MKYFFSLSALELEGSLPRWSCNWKPIATLKNILATTLLDIVIPGRVVCSESLAVFWPTVSAIWLSVSTTLVCTESLLLFWLSVIRAGSAPWVSGRHLNFSKCKVCLPYSFLCTFRGTFYLTQAPPPFL